MATRYLRRYGRIDSVVFEGDKARVTCIMADDAELTINRKTDVVLLDKQSGRELLEEGRVGKTLPHDIPLSETGAR